MSADEKVAAEARAALQSPPTSPLPIELETTPPPSAAGPNLAGGPAGTVGCNVKLWVGTWNMGARDLNQDELRHIRLAFPQGYHMYVPSPQHT